MHVQLEQVSKVYEGADPGCALEILRGIDLEIAPGQSLAVVGPSGSGKTTLLNLIGTLDRPSAGVVRVDNCDLSTLGPDALAEFRNRKLGFIFQLHHLLAHCTVMENVLVPTLALGRRAASGETLARAEAMLARVGLAGRADHRPDQLSGGERQRAAVARALVNRPGLVLADEPTGALDRAHAEALFDLLVELNHSEGVTLIVVTHAEDLARRLDRVLTLDNGRLRAPA